ncbi:hypothetical protein CCAND95_440008 [Capnocytophaga canis]|nr:hypothetical protein CCAND95_440008 [Capnocytophaga canis]
MRKEQQSSELEQLFLENVYIQIVITGMKIINTFFFPKYKQELHR